MTATGGRLRLAGKPGEPILDQAPQAGRPIAEVERELAHLRELIEHSSGGVFRVDFDPPVPLDAPLAERIVAALDRGRVGTANDAMARMYGWSRGGELVGRRLRELVVADDPVTRAALERFFLNGCRFEGVETVERDRDGRRRVFRNGASGVLEDGRLVAIWGTQHDVTDEHDTLARLRESERLFAAAFQDSPLGLSISSLEEGRIEAANDTFLTWIGRTRDEVVGRTAVELGLWSDARSRRALIEEALRDGSTRAVPHVLRTPDGGRLELRLAARRIVVAGRPCLLMSAENVTEIERAQRALAGSEARLRAATEGSLDAFMLLDAVRDDSGRVVDFRLAAVNQVAERLSGRRRDEPIGGSLIGKCPVHRALDGLITRYREAFETGRPWEEEFEIKGHGLRRRWLREQVVPLEQGVAIWARDVSEKHAAEEERRRLEAEFHRGQRLESLGLLAGGVAHDFNNLLTGILGYAEMALRRLPAGAEATAPVREIASAAQRAADLTHKMLAFAGGGPISLAWISLNEVVQEMVELARPALPAGRSVELALARPAPGLEADATQMRQVVLNLLLNASEAITAEHGRIRIETGEVYCEIERLAASVLGAELAEGRYAYVRVVDDGAGMPEEVRDRLFEPFYTTKFTGRGLGLAAVLGIVRAHHGAIEVDSEPGRGAAFTVLLPLSQPPA